MSLSVQSPLRYPGGKSKIAPFIFQKMMSYGANELVEPFAGGASISLYVASQGYRAHINDACPKVSSFWYSVEEDAASLAEVYIKEPITVDNWRTHKLASDESPNGLSTLFLNRTSVNGVLSGAGPIGGFKQDGKYKIDSRAYKQTISSRLLQAGELFKLGLLTVSSDDAIEVIKSAKCNQMLYIDPPYVEAGPKLYPYQFNKHEELRDSLKAVNSEFILSYDDHPMIRSLYDDKYFHIEETPIKYSSKGGIQKIELLISRKR